MHMQDGAIGAPIVAVFLLALAAPAAAQNSVPGDVSAGYQFSQSNGSNGADGTSLPKGWTASFTTHLTPLVNLVGEANGAYKNGEERHHFLTGVRLGGGRSGATNLAVVFGQFLTGLGRSSGNNAFLLQPGIGLDIRGTGTVNARVNFDYVHSRSGGRTDKGFRVAVGLVIDLKRR